MNDDAGNVVTVAQQPGENPQAFGKRVAEALEPMVETADEAKACIDQRTAKPDKAAEAAQKAIKAVPNHGLAHYCLALLAQDKKAARGEVVKQLQASAKGDPLSLPVWTALATQYQQANDTANTLLAFKQMLRVAPTNQKLREELFKYFLQSGHPETALEVADEGLKIDPYNADLYDLKSNACLFLSNFKCAVDALETMYATDSTKADTLFFTKISAAAAEGEQPDTARLLKWSQIGVRKYPDNPTLLGYLNKAYWHDGPGGQRGRRHQPDHRQGHDGHRSRAGGGPGADQRAARGRRHAGHDRHDATGAGHRGIRRGPPRRAPRGPRRRCRSWSTR